MHTFYKCSYIILYYNICILRIKYIFILIDVLSYIYFCNLVYKFINN